VAGQALALGFEAARTHRGPDAWQLLTSREWAREQAERVRMPVAAAATGAGARSRAPELPRSPWLPTSPARTTTDTPRTFRPPTPTA